MLFNSIDFAVFLPIVFVLYWFVTKRSLSLQNILLVCASYLFYGWWDYRFLALIALSTLVDFIVARQLQKETVGKRRKALLFVSLVFNLGMLAFFKYFNFFIESWVDAWQLFGIEMQTATLKIILPVGISFYTFQTLSYTMDVYRKKIDATNSFMQFAAFVSFFPQLVAGPIERASHLLPQFQTKRVFNSEFAISGLYLIIWGLFKKVVVADNCAYFVNQIFDGYGSYSSMELFLGAVLFAFQIYGDFSGYSDIAIGVARLFGFDLKTNFSFPYFSRDIAEFWRRWHISLSTWFRDYLYIPLGGSRGSTWQNVRNVFIVFLVSGFWHGANWTFVVWGAIHAILFLPLLLLQSNRKHITSTKLSLQQVPMLVGTFVVVTMAWVFFRADSVSIGYQYILDIASFNSGTTQVFYKTSKTVLFTAIIVVSIGILLLFEFLAIQKDKKEVELNKYTAIVVVLLICFMGVFKNPSAFIYFQF
jgi:D-alanyl-lipoteichoic acid acyltransferase DltB (MBOAT superfamily)